jgi:hypothetical protein
MGEIVNLRRARKQKERQRAEKDAAANRATFGIAKAARRKARAERELQAQQLDGHKLADSGESE